MGANSSKFESLSKEGVAALVASYGEKYQAYANLIKENGVDGSSLAAMKEQELVATLDKFQVTNRLHRRKFLNLYKGGCSRCPSTSLDISSYEHSCSSTSGSHSSEEFSANDSFSAHDSFNAKISAQAARNRALRKDISRLEVQRTKSGNLKFRPPTKKAALVFTDIEGSTNLWEASPRAMRKALDLHNQIIRKLIPDHAGYEYNTEGDAFAVAFHEASEAIAFSLKMQSALNKADWSEDILALKWARDTGNGRRGLRVRVSVHMGNVTSRKDAVTGLTKYSGEAVEVTKSVEGIAAGGQILITYDVWNAAFHLADSYLGSPLVANMGAHTIAHKTNSSAKDIRKRILEVAPPCLNIMGKPVEA